MVKIVSFPSNFERIFENYQTPLIWWCDMISVTGKGKITTPLPLLPSNKFSDWHYCHPDQWLTWPSLEKNLKVLFLMFFFFWNSGWFCGWPSWEFNMILWFNACPFEYRIGFGCSFVRFLCQCVKFSHDVFFFLPFEHYLFVGFQSFYSVYLFIWIDMTILFFCSYFLFILLCQEFWSKHFRFCMLFWYWVWQKRIQVE